MVWPFSFPRKSNDTDIIYAEDWNAAVTDLEDVGNLPNFATRRIMQVHVFPGSTTINTAGMGTPSLAGTATTADDSDGPLVNYATTAVSGNAAGWNISPPLLRAEWLPSYVCRAKLPADISSSRFWLGIFSGAPTGGDTPAISYAGFRYSTAASDPAFWQCLTDNGSGTPTKVNTNVAVAINTAYVFRLRMDTTKVEFWINDVPVATITTTLPAASTVLGYWAAVTTLTTAARNIKLSRLALGHK
jgi:hypothetical protein